MVDEIPYKPLSVGDVRYLMPESSPIHKITISSVEQIGNKGRPWDYVYGYDYFIGDMLRSGSDGGNAIFTKDVVLEELTAERDGIDNLIQTISNDGA